MVNMHEKPSLLKNRGERGNSVLIRLLTTSGRDAIGARLTLHAGGSTQIDEVRSGGNYVSQSDFRIHFGLGTERKAGLGVRWPDGTSETLLEVQAGQLVTIQQGRGIVDSKRILSR